MITNSTVRSFGGSVYVKIPPQYAEYFRLKEHLERAKQKGIEPDCKVEDKAENKLVVTFPKW